MRSLGKGRDRFADANALWRRWTTGPARVHEGAAVAEAPLAVVVIGYRAPAEMPEAVLSVLDQEPRAEVVVVNSGGGDPVRVLSGLMDRIRLVEVDERLFVGAARNIGIDASDAPVVAFLASDCLAAPGWVAARLRRHRAGALAVSSPVVPHRPGSRPSLVTSAIMHRRRRPDCDPDEVVHFGLSYARDLLRDHGYFAPGLRVGEDTEFNAAIAETARPHWAPEVLTRHRYPEHLPALVLDMAIRGRRRAAHPPFLTLHDGGRPARRLVTLWRRRVDEAREAIRRSSALAPAAGLRGRVLVELAGMADMAGVLLGLARRRKVGADGRLRGTDRQNAQTFVDAARAALAQDRATGEIVALYERASALAPRDPVIPTEMCNLLIRERRLDLALTKAENAVIAAPRIWRKASEIALRLNRPEEALFHARQAFVLSPASPAAHRTLIAALAAAGAVAEAPRRKRLLRDLEATLADPPQ